MLLRDLGAVLGPHVGIVAPDGFSEFRALIEEAGVGAEGLLVSVATVPLVRGAPLGRAFAEAFEKAIGDDADPTRSPPPRSGPTPHRFPGARPDNRQGIGYVGNGAAAAERAVGERRRGGGRRGAGSGQRPLIGIAERAMSSPSWWISRFSSVAGIERSSVAVT